MFHDTPRFVSLNAGPVPSRPALLPSGYLTHLTHTHILRTVLCTHIQYTPPLPLSPGGRGCCWEQWGVFLLAVSSLLAPVQSGPFPRRGDRSKVWGPGPPVERQTGGSGCPSAQFPLFVSLVPPQARTRQRHARDSLTVNILSLFFCVFFFQTGVSQAQQGPAIFLSLPRVSVEPRPAPCWTTCQIRQIFTNDRGRSGKPCLRWH